MKLNYKSFCLLMFLLLSMETMFGQATIVKWDFNSTTGTITPVVGSGTATLIGTSATFKSGEGSTDLAASSPSNFGWQTSSYASLGTLNKQCGVQFNVNTVGYHGITLKFDQRLSPSASNTYVVQYTVDRTATTPVWSDAQTFTFVPAATGTGDKWYNGRPVDLSAIKELDNNPNVAIRIVSAFDPSASNYLAASSTSSYSPVGSVRFDMVTVSGVQALGVEDYSYEKRSFSFYPNPTNGNFIYFNQTVSVKIFDVTGKMVLSAKGVKELNLESLSSGLYFVENEDKKLIKLVKN